MSSSPGDGRVGSAHQAQPGGHSPPYDPAAAEIQAEIDDHLATAAERLQSQGLAENEAHERSRDKFGDAAAISRRCYWIKQGDALMFRAAVIGLLSILCLALGATVITSWRSQRQMAEQMVALAEQLKLLADQQRAASTPAPAADTKPLEITGNVFIGSPDKPSPNTEIMICRVNDGEIVRRTATNDVGVFESGPLGAGDYAVVASGVKHPSWKGEIGNQTAPLYLYPGKPTPTLAIDVAYRYGSIAVKLSRPLPMVKVDGKYVIDSRLILVARPSYSTVRDVRWTVANPAPERWPLYIENPQTAPKNGGNNLMREVVLSNEGLREEPIVQFRDGSDLAAGTWWLAASIRADVVPDGPLKIDEMIFNNRSYRHPPEDRQWMSNYWVENETMGQVWTLMLGKRRYPNFPYTSLRSLNRDSAGDNVDWATVSIDDGHLTTLLIDIPDDITSQIQQLVDNVTDAEQFIERVDEKNPFVRPAKITVVGSQPFADSEFQ